MLDEVIPLDPGRGRRRGDLTTVTRALATARPGSADPAPRRRSSPSPAPPEPQFTAVMPVWNEGDRVVPTIRAFAAAVRVPYGLLVVHDMLEDTTPVPVVEALRAEVPGCAPTRTRWDRACSTP